MRSHIYLGFLLPLLFLSGCLSASRGTTETIEIITDPVGADIEAELLQQDGNPALSAKNQPQLMRCTPSPCSLKIPRLKHARILVSKDGFHSIKFLVVSKGSSPTSTIRPGVIVAGHPSGSHVIAGTPETITTLLSGNTLTGLEATATYGLSILVNNATGANRSFSPNPVLVRLAPLEPKPEPEPEPDPEPETMTEEAEKDVEEPGT